MRKTILPFMLAAMLPSSMAFAAGQMKPGLWEMTLKSDAMKNMPRIPPEQLEQMRKMGVNIPQMRDGGMVSKVCVTPQMAESSEIAGMDKNEMGCQTKNLQRSGNDYSADIVCEGPDMKGTGKTKGSFFGNERFTATHEFKGVVHGQPVNQRQETSGKWLSADCGNVKPAGAGLPKR